jgi:hypothetical protein
MGDLPTLNTLDELAAVLDGRDDLYVRWSRGPDVDRQTSSTDDLTGVPLPGLSVNPLALEEWWEGRSLRLWVARRLYDYRHLRDKRGPGVRPWILSGRELARGPDNEPLVDRVQPIAWLHEDVVAAAQRMVDEQTDEWGPLRRR